MWTTRAGARMSASSGLLALELVPRVPRIHRAAYAVRPKLVMPCVATCPCALAEAAAARNTFIPAAAMPPEVMIGGAGRPGRAR
jgi:hypothetical protein